MKLTLKKIMEYNPCGQNSNSKIGISKLAKYLGKTDFNDEEEFTLIDVLNSNGIDNAVWCLRCFNYLDYCLFSADVAESVLYIYEASNDSKAPRNCIQAIRDFKAGKITREQLNAATADIYATIAYTTDVYNDDASASSSSAYSAAAAASSAAYAVVSSAIYTSSPPFTSNARKEKWLEIEKLFIKHFGE